jgi:hypothetical protein
MTVHGRWLMVNVKSECGPDLLSAVSRINYHPFTIYHLDQK